MIYIGKWGCFCICKNEFRVVNIFKVIIFLFIIVKYKLLICVIFFVVFKSLKKVCLKIIEIIFNIVFISNVRKMVWEYIEIVLFFLLFVNDLVNRFVIFVFKVIKIVW